ncbi:MAG: response regulator [Magnetococcales bacterium]|nr:response regulator [Magnetococcales bacterium]
MPSVLLIEDDLEYCKLISRILTDHGYEVQTANDGDKGLQVYRNHPADVILTDMIMPEMDGVALIRALKHDDPKPRIIAMSGGGRHLHARFNLEIAETLGVHACLTKPFSKDELLFTLQDIIH